MGLSEQSVLTQFGHCFFVSATRGFTLGFSPSDKLIHALFQIDLCLQAEDGTGV